VRAFEAVAVAPLPTTALRVLKRLRPSNQKPPHPDLNRSYLVDTAEALRR
jgi:hypothetical protein